MLYNDEKKTFNPDKDCSYTTNTLNFNGSYKGFDNLKTPDEFIPAYCCQYLLLCGICEKTGKACPKAKQHTYELPHVIYEKNTATWEDKSDYVTKVNDFTNYKLPDDYDDAIGRLNSYTIKEK